MTVLAPIFFAIALVYSMVGLAGGSSYLACLAWLEVPREILVPTALLCNLVVSAQSAYAYISAGFFRSHLFWPLILGSVPFAFLGGLTPISDKTFHLLLGFALLFAALRMFFPKGLLKEKILSAKFFSITGFFAGAFLGFLAGLVGLGGGIFLAPLLILSGTATAKQTAAVTAPFIFVNSLSGLAAHHSHLTSSLFVGAIPLLIVVACGGFFGARLGAYRLQPLWVQRTSALLLSFVGFKLLGRVPG